MVKRARQLKKEKGILPDPDPENGRAILDQVVGMVIDFYESDEFFRMCPGKKGCISVKQGDHLSDSCPGKEAVEEYLANLFNDNDFDHDDMIIYK